MAPIFEATNNPTTVADEISSKFDINALIDTTNQLLLPFQGIYVDKAAKSLHHTDLRYINVYTIIMK